MRPGDDDYEAQLEALRMLELERQAQVDAGALGTNMPGAKVEFAPDSGMTPEPSRVPIQPKVVDLTTQPKGNLERSKAMRADWDNRSSQALERAGRELVAGLTRTQAAPTSEWDTGHFARFVADQERAAQREGRATQAQLAGKKIDFDKAEAARKAANEEQHRKEDLEEKRIDNDRAERGLAAQIDTNRQLAGIRGMEVQNKKQDRDDKAAAGVIPFLGGTFTMKAGLSDSDRSKARDYASSWNTAMSNLNGVDGALSQYLKAPSPETKGQVEAQMVGALTALNVAYKQGAMADTEARRLSEAMGVDLLSGTGIAAAVSAWLDGDAGRAGQVLQTKLRALKDASARAAQASLSTYGDSTGGSSGGGGSGAPRPTATGANGEKYQLSADGKSWEPIK